MDLAYPLCLDVPMMTSFVAALEDGIAYGSDVVQTRDQRRAVTAEGEGKTKAGLPSIGVLASLLNFDLRGKITSGQAVGSADKWRKRCSCTFHIPNWVSTSLTTPSRGHLQ